MRFFHGFEKNPKGRYYIKDDIGISRHVNAIFIPKYSAIYDENGGLLVSSVVARGKMRMFSAAPISLDKSEMKDLVYIDEALFIGSLGQRHFGHFITEQLARLWVLIQGKHHNCPIIFHCGDPTLDRKPVARNFDELPGYQREILTQIPGLDSERFMFMNRGVRVGVCHLPAPSFLIRGYVTPAHVELTRHCAEQLLYNRQQKQDRRIYFSRSRLGTDKRLIHGEQVLEEKLREDFQFEVHHPQELTMADQIALVNSATVIAGALGSALHNIMFCLNENTKLICLSSSTINTNYLMIDAITGIETHYLHCLSELKDYKTPVTLDSDRALNLIKAVL